MNLLVITVICISAYFIYTKVVSLYISKSYYEKQGVPFIKGVKPILGNLIRFKEVMDKYKNFEVPQPI